MDTPELDKRKKVIDSGKAEAVQDFIDWLAEKGYEIAYWETHHEAKCEGVRLTPWQASNCRKGVVRRSLSNGPVSVTAGDLCPECDGEGAGIVERAEPRLAPLARQPEQIMADHFGLDLNKIEQEQRALLEAITDS